MTTTLQSHLADQTLKAVKDLEEALGRIPEDKLHWSPEPSARSAMSMIAECGLLNDMSRMLASRSFPKDFDFAAWQGVRDELAKDKEKAVAAMKEGAAKTAEAIRGVSADEMDQTIDLPWGPMTVAQICAYPSWNMAYHEGQINYIASILGTLP